MTMPNGESRDETRLEVGTRVRRSVLGDEHVDRALASQTPFDAPFQRFITEVAWGSLWSRPDLEPKTRSLITIALLAALGRREELEVHLRATRNTGASPEEVREALLHVAVYAGVPAANSAFTLARTIVGLRDESVASTPKDMAP
jgi:4-carboxymuconolactone decarboxylase